MRIKPIPFFPAFLPAVVVWLLSSGCTTGSATVSDMSHTGVTPGSAPYIVYVESFQISDAQIVSDAADPQREARLVEMSNLLSMHIVKDLNQSGQLAMQVNLEDPVADSGWLVKGQLEHARAGHLQLAVTVAELAPLGGSALIHFDVKSRNNAANGAGLNLLLDEGADVDDMDEAAATIASEVLRLARAASVAGR